MKGGVITLGGHQIIRTGGWCFNYLYQHFFFLKKLLPLLHSFVTSLLVEKQRK